MQEARKILEGVFEIAFEERESLYWGIYFSYKRPNFKGLELKRNIDPFDNEPAIVEFSDYSVLLYVTEDEEDLESISVVVDGLSKFVLLKKEVL